MKKLLERVPGPTISLPKGHSLPMEFATIVKPDGKSLDIRKSREIDFAHFGDGTLIDLVQAGFRELTFAVFQQGAACKQKELRREDIDFVPPSLESGLMQAVRFPKAVGANHTARELLAEIENVLDAYYDCDPADRKLLAHFAIYSWVADLFPIAPYIWILGPWGYGKTTLLQIMSAVCRRSLLAGDVSLASLYRVTTELHPTLLLDEFDSRSRELLRMLRSGSDGRENSARV